MFDEVVLNLDLKQHSNVAVKSRIFEDNNGAIATATTPKLSPRTKHIAVKYHFVKNYFGTEHNPDHPFELVKIASEEQKADMFTKGLSTATFLRIRKLLCNY